MFKYPIFILLLITSSSIAYASSHLSTDTFQNKVPVLLETNNFKNIGNTTFSILFWDLYKSKLMTTSGKYPINVNNEKLIYEIEYLANISRDDLISRTVEQWEHLGISKIVYQNYIPELKRIWPDIKQGNTLSLLYQEGSSNFYFNKKYIGSIKSRNFGPLFLNIWLDKKTSQPRLRKELLGEFSEI